MIIKLKLIIYVLYRFIGLKRSKGS